MIDTTHRDTVICPECGHAHGSPTDVFEGTNGDDGTTCQAECSECGANFQAIRHVTVTYSTRSLKNRKK